MRQPRKRKISRRRSHRMQYTSGGNILIRFINSTVNGIRKWFLRKHYAPAVCLGIATVIAMTVVCVYALPVPKSAVSQPDVSEIAVARTEVPAETFSTTESTALYDELKTTNTAGKVSAIIYDKEVTADNVTVYAAEDAECYHLGDCKFAFASSKRLTAYEAYYLHYRPCGRCNPPVYDPVTGKCS